jgi:predicted ATPase
VILVELRPIRIPSLVPSAVAAAAGGWACGRSTGRGGARRSALAADDILMVLDTCEHLVDAVGDLVLRLLGRCPSLRMLATSRRVRGLPGEHVWRVPPLGLGSAVDLFQGIEPVCAYRMASIEASGDETVEQICR